MTSIKNEIIGSWKLLSYIEVPIGGGESLFPMGKSPKGNLIFSPDGYMSVQIANSEISKFKVEDRLMASDEELISRVKGYIAFSGRYVVDNLSASVTYQIETSLYPNWEGVTQVRKLDFEGDVLYQRSLHPILSAGEFVHTYMTWQKMEKVAVDVLMDRELNNGLYI